MQARTVLPAMSAQSRVRESPATSLGAWALRLLQACLPWPEAARPQAAARPAGVQRHVWANGLALHVAPDARAPELARLPRGAVVELPDEAATPVPHRATALRCGLSLTLDGHWREVLADGQRGWVFDGCLSRYPAPSACDAQGLAYAARVFGVGTADGIRHKWLLEEHAGAAEVYWTRVNFDLAGGRLSMAGQGATENLAQEGMPLTFNEALLWWLHFQRQPPV